MRRASLLIVLPLAACSPGGNTLISIEGEGGNISIGSDADGGRAEISGPGISGSIRLPKIDIEAADFDVNGVKLYPGSTIRDFNLNAKDRIGEKDDAKLSISFESPASLDKVQTWFRDNMAERGFKVEPRDGGFSGTTDEGDPLTIDLRAAGTDKTAGRMSVGA